MAMLEPIVIACLKKNFRSPSGRSGAGRPMVVSALFNVVQKKENIVITQLKLLTLAAAVFSFSATVAAEENQSFQVTVDVSMPAHKMYANIKKQARRACQQSVGRSVLLNYNAAKVAKCQNKMVNAVIKSLDLPGSTAIHEQT